MSSTGRPSRLGLPRAGSRGLSGPGGAYGRLAPVRPGGRWNAGAAALPKSLLQRAFAKNSPLRHLDWILLATVLALSLIGTMLVWSATRGADPRTYFVKQVLAIAIGLALLLGTAVLDYRRLRVYAPVLYGISILGLIAALTPARHPGQRLQVLDHPARGLSDRAVRDRQARGHPDGGGGPERRAAGRAGGPGCARWPWRPG